MAEILLLYPTEKLEAAVRLAEAIEAQGYRIDRRAIADPGAFPGVPADSGQAKALILIWSRGLVTAAMAGGLAEVRRHPNLIEVSVDGIEPAFGAETSPVVLLSGWRGQPFHLGWQHILADLKRLVPKDAPAKSRKAVAADRPGRSPAETARRRPSLRAAVAGGALLAATLGVAAAALDWGGPGAAPHSGAPTAIARSGPPPAASAPAPASPAPTVPEQGVAGPSPADALPAPAAPASSASLQTTAPEPAAPRKSAAPRTGAKRLAAAPEPEMKRYSRKYSKTMRLFCQRSGRSTPQCRTFARSMRSQRG